MNDKHVLPASQFQQPDLNGFRAAIERSHMDFETIGKDKLPSNLAFPVSAAILQEKLASVPQKAEVSVCYSIYKTMTARRQQKTKFGKSHRTIKDDSRNIIEATYKRSDVYLTTPNAWLQEQSFMNTYTRDQWKLSIHALPLSDLAALRKCLEEEGYAKITTWFVDTNKYSGSIGSYGLIIAFDGGKLTYRQFDNQ